MMNSIAHIARPQAPRGNRRRIAFGLLLGAALLAWPQTAEAQLDPLLFLKRSLPTITTAQYRANVLLAVDTAQRMQYDADGDFYDPHTYAPGNIYDNALGVSGANTTSAYRRVYKALQWSSSGPQRFNTSRISIVGDRQGAAYTNFYGKTRLGVVKAAIDQAVRENTISTRFGLLKTRQNNPHVVSSADGPVLDADAGQQLPTDGVGAGLWKLYRSVADSDNRSIETSTPALVKPDSATPNTNVLTAVGSASTTLMAAGNNSYGVDDASLAHLLDDVRTEAARLITADTQCRNTVAILFAGGGEGTGGHIPTAAATAATFVSISSRRVPVYVIAIAPPSTAVAELKAIATFSGGQYFEVTKAEIDASFTAGVAAPTAVRGINTAIQHAFAYPSDVNTAPTVALPYGPQSEYLVTSPIVGTVNLTGARTLAGTTLPGSETDITNPKTGADIPQRANVMVTAAFALPGFEARLRAFRVYKPVSDTTKPSGYKFTQDGTALWVAATPTKSYCNDATASCRNIFTVLPDGSTVAFTTANSATLGTYLNTWDVDGLINFVRTQPLGAIVSSTPAIMDAPSLDPPPDPDYPGFADDNKDRRSIIFVGANDGMMHGIDGRTGLEVWAFIPFNLLPKLKTLRDGQPIDGFDYFVDASTKVADVKVDDKWRTFVVFGEGPGGTFYQAFDATMDDMALSVSPTSDSIPDLLAFFSNPSRIQYLWSFPRYSVFDPAVGTYGDLSASASADEKTVGQTWSDPAIGQVKNANGKYTVITGSGFFPRSKETVPNRGSVSAGRALYLIDAGTGPNASGLVLDRKEPTPASDSVAEADDNCLNVSYGCTKIKNALQADPVATGPSDSRFITKSYIGDLDGNIWRFDIDVDASNNPRFPSAPVKLASMGADQPVFSSMATVAVGTQQYLFFGTGSDLLPLAGQNTVFKLIGVLDNGGSGTVTFQHTLAKVDGTGDDEVVTSFPAVAGDIVFFTTSTLKPENPCVLGDVNLYALTFVGGAAYDATGDGKVSKTETPKVKTLAGAGRATAPFIVDQHLAFGAGSKVEMFGDSTDYNNGVGHVGVRILSWRDLR